MPPLSFSESVEDFAKRSVVTQWDESEWSAFYAIIQKESSWTVTTAHYPTGIAPSGVRSSAHGLAGFLDSSWETVGCVKTDNAKVQITCAITYIAQRYGTPKKAIQFHAKNNWY